MDSITEMLHRCSTTLLAEVLVFHLQRARARQVQGSLMDRAKVLLHTKERQVLYILADAIIRDYNGATGVRAYVVQNYLQDLIQFTPHAPPDLDWRMVQTIAHELRRRDPPTNLMDCAASHGSSREYEFVATEDETIPPSPTPSPSPHRASPIMPTSYPSQSTICPQLGESPSDLYD